MLAFVTAGVLYSLSLELSLYFTKARKAEAVAKLATNDTQKLNDKLKSL